MLHITSISCCLSAIASRCTAVSSPTHNHCTRPMILSHPRLDAVSTNSPDWVVLFFVSRMESIVTFLYSCIPVNNSRELGTPRWLQRPEIWCLRRSRQLISEVSALMFAVAMCAIDCHVAHTRSRINKLYMHTFAASFCIIQWKEWNGKIDQ